MDVGDLRRAGIAQARLFGVGRFVAGGIDALGQNGSDVYVRRAWDQWWREREQFSDCTLPLAALAVLNSLRPANHPQRRLALAAHWLASGDLPARLEKWFTATLPDATLAESLLETLQVERDDFGRGIWTFWLTRG